MIRLRQQGDVRGVVETYLSLHVEENIQHKLWNGALSRLQRNVYSGVWTNLDNGVDSPVRFFVFAEVGS